MKHQRGTQKGSYRDCGCSKQSIFCHEQETLLVCRGGAASRHRKRCAMATGPAPAAATSTSASGVCCRTLSAWHQQQIAALSSATAVTHDVRCRVQPELRLRCLPESARLLGSDGHRRCAFHAGASATSAAPPSREAGAVVAVATAATAGAGGAGAAAAPPRHPRGRQVSNSIYMSAFPHVCYLCPQLGKFWRTMLQKLTRCAEAAPACILRRRPGAGTMYCL